MSDFESDKNKLIEFDAYASFLVTGTTYIYSNLAPVLQLDADAITGRAFADTNMVVLGVGMIVILGRSALRGIRSLSSKKLEL